MPLPISGLHPQAEAWRLHLPLKEPYYNALGPLPYFDCIVLKLSTSDGQIGWGEACPVTGYSPESPDEGWDFVRAALVELRRRPLAEALAYAQAHHQRFPFVASAIAEAVSRHARDHLLTPVDRPTKVELAGTVNSLSIEDACQRAVALCDSGYRTLKVKVGYEPDADVARVNAISDAVQGRARLRVDANQGYNEDAALRFACGARGDAIEFFEQPLPADAWEGLARVTARSPLPVMLDESIYASADIERAAREVGARAVKVKMSKAGGPAGLKEQVDTARSLGLEVVVGNGVASDLGCLHETLCFVHLGLDTAAEFNGFLKLTSPLLDATLSFTAPHVRLDPGPLSQPSQRALAQFAVDRVGESARPQ